MANSASTSTQLARLSRGGSDQVSNLTLPCRKCNQNKGNQTVAEYGYPPLTAQARQPFRGAAAVNTARRLLYRKLQESGLPIECGTGGRTTYNRSRQGYPKEHWIEAACAGISGERVFIAR